MQNPQADRISEDGGKPVQAQRGRGGLARSLLLVLLPLVVGPLVVVALLLYLQAQSDITNQVTAQLTSISIAKQNQIDQWAADRTTDMSNLGRSPDIVQAARALVLNSSDSNAVSAANSTLQQRFDDYVANSTYFQVLLLARADSGAIVVANRGGQRLVGQSLSPEPFFSTARQGPQVAPIKYYPEIVPDSINVVATAPVVDPQQGTIAVLVGLVPDEQLIAIVAPSAGLGRSGRAYIVTGDHYELGTLINPSTPKLDSLGIQLALTNQENSNGVYLNPVGQRVVGAYNWLPRFDIALLVEESVDEAYASIARDNALFAIVGALAVVVGVAGALVLTRNLTRPIQDLTEGAMRMADGDLNVVVESKRQDEIGILSRAFNSMASQLKDSLATLEQRVDERTGELARASTALRRQNEYLTALHDTTLGLVQRLDLEELLEAIINRAGALTGTTHGYVFLTEPGRDDMEMRVGVGAYVAFVGSHATRGVGLAGQVWETGRPINIDDYRTWPGRLKDPRRDVLRAVVGLPLRSGNQIIGVLGVAQVEEGRRFGPAEIEVLDRFAELASVALDNVRLFERTQTLLSEAQKRAEREAMLAAITDRIHASTEPRTILRIAAEELRRSMGGSRAVIRLSRPDKAMSAEN